MFVLEYTLIPKCGFLIDIAFWFLYKFFCGAKAEFWYVTDSECLFKTARDIKQQKNLGYLYVFSSWGCFDRNQQLG